MSEPWILSLYPDAAEEYRKVSESVDATIAKYKAMSDAEPSVMSQLRSLSEKVAQLTDKVDELQNCVDELTYGLLIKHIDDDK